MRTNKELILLSTLLRATGKGNIYRYSGDKKERGKIVGQRIGVFFLYLMLAAYAALLGFGYNGIGAADAIPGSCIMLVSLTSFVFTVLKTNGYLFAFKEYDTLMSMPFTVKDIVSARFLLMYLKSLPLQLCISIPMLISYALFMNPSVLVYIVWIVLSALMPLLPMVLASAVGALIAAAGSGFRHKKLVQTILIFIFVLFCFSLRFIIDAVARENQFQQVLTDLRSMILTSAVWYRPILWFDRAIGQLDVLSMLLFIAVSYAVYVLFSLVVARNYRKVNSRLMASHARKDYRMNTLKTRSQVTSIAYKEFRTFLSSTNYMVNCGLGEVLILIFGIAALFVPAESIISIITQGAPVTTDMLLPAVPLLVYLLIGMVSTTSCSPSLEGKSFWIMQSLPVDALTVYKGKILFNICLAGPFMVFSTVCFCIGLHASFLQFVLYLAEGVVLLLFSSVWGLVCGVRHIKLKWTNDIEVIKQGSAVAIYMLPNMFITMGLVVGVIILSMRMSGILVNCMILAVAAVLALLSWLAVKGLARKGLKED